jgi:hypothetical protein
MVPFPCAFRFAMKKFAPFVAPPQPFWYNERAQDAELLDRLVFAFGNDCW